MHVLLCRKAILIIVLGLCLLVSRFVTGPTYSLQRLDEGKALCASLFLGADMFIINIFTVISGCV